MGDTAERRKQAPTKRAAVAGIVVAGLALVIVTVGLVGRASGETEWRDAALPTYAAGDWTGEPVPVAEGLTLELAVADTLCPTAVAVGGGAVAVVLADTWRGTYPVTTGFVPEDPAPRIQEGRDGSLLETPADGTSDIAVTGRFLDLAAPDDAALADAWTVACGEAEAFVQAAPDGLIGGEVAG